MLFFVRGRGCCALGAINNRFLEADWASLKIWREPADFKGSIDKALSWVLALHLWNPSELPERLGCPHAG